MIVYTDGSCLKNPNGPGGYGWICFDENEKEENRIYLESSGGEDSTTNNRMELKAVIDCLEHISFDYLTIYSDSKYVVDSINKNYKRNKNLDLWKEFNRVKKGKRITLNWVKGHSGNEFNDYVDELARGEAENRVI